MKMYTKEELSEKNKAYYKRNKLKIIQQMKDARVENFARYLLNNTRHKCKKYNLEFDLDYEWVEEVYTGKCSLSNIPFVVDHERWNLYKPSIDRIDNARGYTKDNCRFILLALNTFKGVGRDSDIYYIAEELVKHRSAYNQ